MDDFHLKLLKKIGKNYSITVNSGQVFAYNKTGLRCLENQSVTYKKT